MCLVGTSRAEQTGPERFNGSIYVGMGRLLCAQCRRAFNAIANEDEDAVEIGWDGSDGTDSWFCC